MRIEIGKIVVFVGGNLEILTIVKVQRAFRLTAFVECDHQVEAALSSRFGGERRFLREHDLATANENTDTIHWYVHAQVPALVGPIGDDGLLDVVVPDTGRQVGVPLRLSLVHDRYNHYAITPQELILHIVGLRIVWKQ